MFYIQENDKPSFLERKFKILKLEGNIIEIPISNKEKEKQRIATKLIKKIRKNTNSKKIILSKKIKKQEVIVNELKSNGMKIMDGKMLAEILLVDMLIYIINKKNIQNAKISILINDVTDIEIENIKEIALKYKRVNIVTNHIEKFGKIEEKLSKEYGISILIENNRKRSLSKSDIILNIDFPQELINKYNINENAVILNVKEKTRINKKRFNGLVINDYEITYRNDEKIDEEKYSLRDIYEAKIYKQKILKDIKLQINKDKVRIEKLILNNGIM